MEDKREVIKCLHEQGDQLITQSRTKLPLGLMKKHRKHLKNIVSKNT